MHPDTHLQFLPRKVIGLGLSRTATTALHECTEALGYKSVHYPVGLFAQERELFGISRPPYPGITRLGKSRYKRQQRNYSLKFADELTRDNTALFDLPIPLYVEELAERQPDALYLYTTRPMASWLESMRWLYNEGRYLWRFSNIDESILFAMYGCTKFDKDKLIEARSRYETKLKNIEKSRRINIIQIDIEQNPITLSRVSKLIGIDRGKLEEEAPKIINGRRKASYITKIDYNLCRTIPKYPMLSSRLRGLKR
jgi:hypothetical protein